MPNLLQNISQTAEVNWAPLSDVRRVCTTSRETQVEMKASGIGTDRSRYASHHGEEVGMPDRRNRKRAHNVHVDVAEPAARYWNWMHRGHGLRSEFVPTATLTLPAPNSYIRGTLLPDETTKHEATRSSDTRMR
jgi:hypothetical protein